MTTGSRLQPAPRAYHYLLLGAAVVTFGFNWPILDRGVELVPPLWLMNLRLWGGALVGFGMGALTGQQLTLPRQDWKTAPILGIFRLLAIFMFVFFALQILPPGRSGVLVWTGTLWTVPLAMIFLGERMSKMQVAGLTIGMGGLIVVLEPWNFGGAEPGVIWGYLMLMGAALSVAWTSVFIRAHKWEATPLASTLWQMLAGGVPALVAALAIDGLPDIDWTWETAGIVAYQMTLAGPMVVWAQLEAFRHLSAISVNLTLMVTPVIGLLASWWLVDEALTLTLWAGLVLLTVGVAANILGFEDVRAA